MVHFKLLASFALVASAFMASVQAQTSALPQWEVKTPNDHYVIEDASGTRGKLAGKEVNIAPLTKFTNLFVKQKFDAECPTLPAKAPIEVTRIKDSERKTWKLYVKQGIWSDGTHCLAVSGEGLNNFPVHRSWFGDGGRRSVELGNRFSLVIGKDTLTFVNDRGHWTNSDPDFYTNWATVETLVSTLNGFSISERTTKKPATDAPQFTIRAAGKNHHFVKMGNDWALRESAKWLAISPDFRWLKEMSLEALRSPNAAELAKLRNSDTPEEERIALMKKLAGAYNSDIKHAVQELVMKNNESAEIKRQAAQVIRHHPTDDSILVLARALLKSNDPEVLRVMTDALRVKNPKGPRISSLDSPAEIENKIQTWQKWADEFQKQFQK